MVSSRLNENIKSLHIIRGICALLVVIYHAKFVLWCGGSMWVEKAGFQQISDYVLFFFDMLSSCGMQCVLVFFLLSGFVIHFSFYNSDKKVGHFYLIRAIRIYVPYLFSLAISILVLLAVMRYAKGIFVWDVREYNSRLLIAYADLNPVTILKSMIFVPSHEYAGFNFAYWSLLHEAIFYLVFPLYFFAGFRMRVAFLIAVTAGFVITGSGYLYFQIYFLIGMLLFDYYKMERAPLFKKRKLYPILIFIGFLLINGFAKLSYHYTCDLTAVVVTILFFDYVLVTGLKASRFFSWLADISFTLYLNHLTVLLVCYAVFASLLRKLIFFERYPYYIGAVMAVIVSAFFYKLVEVRSLTLIKKIKKKWNT